MLYVVFSLSSHSPLKIEFNTSGWRYLRSLYTFHRNWLAFNKAIQSTLLNRAKLHVRDTYALYLEAVHISDNLSGTTVTLNLNDPFKPLSIGGVRMGDGIATIVHSYSEWVYILILSCILCELCIVLIVVRLRTIRRVKDSRYNQGESGVRV